MNEKERKMRDVNDGGWELSNRNPNNNIGALLLSKGSNEKSSKTGDSTSRERYTLKETNSLKTGYTESSK
jgi:hypothetical protein